MKQIKQKIVQRTIKKGLIQNIINPELPVFYNTNKKLGRNTAVFNMAPAVRCESCRRGFCQVPDGKCYALRSEFQYKAVYPKRVRENLFWDYTDASSFVDLFLQWVNQKQIKELRFNESGDLRDARDLMKVLTISKLLEQYNIRVYIYTARIDIINSHYMPVRDKYTNLTVNGSGFMADNEFRFIPKSVDMNMLPENPVCCGDCKKCSLCKNKNGYIIYDREH